MPERELRLVYNASFYHFNLMCEGRVEGKMGSRLHVSHRSASSRLLQTTSGVHNIRGGIRNISTTAMYALGAPPTVYGKFDVVRRTMHAVTLLVGSSPRGTGADCHRHVELLLASLTVIANEDKGGFQEGMYASQPITFIGNHWTSIICASMLNLIKGSILSHHNDEYERLTAVFWRRYIVDEVCPLLPSQEMPPSFHCFPQEFLVSCHKKLRSRVCAK